MIRDITWSLAAPMPVAVKGHAQGVIGMSVVLYCGTQFEAAAPGDVRKGSLTALARKGWRLEAGAWTCLGLPDAPVGVKWAGSAVMDGAFYLLTGMLPDSAASPRMFRLSMSSNSYEWSEMPRMQVGRFIPGIAAVGTMIHVVGGETAAGRTESSAAVQATSDSMEVFDTANPKQGWVCAPPLPGLSREAMGIAAIGKTLYVFGGLHMTPPATDAAESVGDPYTLCGDAYAYDADRETWRRLPDLPFPCYGWQASVWADRYIILAAGVKKCSLEHLDPPGQQRGDLKAPNHHVLVYDVVTMTYRELPTRLPPAFVLPAAPEMMDDYTDPGQRELARKYVATVKEASKTMDLGAGGFRISPGLSVIGNMLYMTGGECLTPHASTSDELLIGTLVSSETNV